MSIAATVLSVLLAAVFLFSGGRKIPGGETAAGEAAHLRIPLTGYRTIGAAEVAGAAGLIIGIFFAPLGIAAAAGLVLLMPGALIAHLRAGDPASAWAPAAALTVVAAVTLVLRITTA
ncbi:hypothetical protein GCM10022222_07600 [Amycolatopsis ultiminotia]|uniref:DoxX-like family protein n=1 Tax=Amycolatopsis ultiminotia TaxID=543629 RepID=A0ABP6V4Y1_9PSEU